MADEGIQNMADWIDTMAASVAEDTIEQAREFGVPAVAVLVDDPVADHEDPWLAFVLAAFEPPGSRRPGD